jgi:hypothetical protein
MDASTRAKVVNRRVSTVVQPLKRRMSEAVRPVKRVGAAVQPVKRRVVSAPGMNAACATTDEWGSVPARVVVSQSLCAIRPFQASSVLFRDRALTWATGAGVAWVVPAEVEQRAPRVLHR